MPNPDKFRELELNQDLFNIYIDNIPVWEYTRPSVWRKLRQQSGGGQAHTKIKKTSVDYLKGVKLFIQNSIYKNPFLSDDSDLMFVGHPRRKRESDGCWWDLYCDPIHESCDYDYVHFESDHLLKHHQPAKTENLRYLDVISYGSTIQRRLFGIEGTSIPASAQAQLEEAENSFSQQFGAKVDLVEKIQLKLNHRKANLWMYRRLLNRVDPECVVLVVSYGKEILIEACQEQSIPVIELQHGVIHNNHFGYSYSAPRTKEMFPDYLLVWGDYWKDVVEYPIPDENVIPVGYPYLEQSIEKYDGIESKEQILFISQGTIGERLSKFALEIEEHPDIEHDIVYKLHPGEYDRWQDEYPWLVDAGFDVIDNSEPPLYELFAESSVQIGVGSTAVFEGLCFDIETYVYDCPGSSVLDALVDEGAAELISSVDELVSSLGTGGVAFDHEYYFEPNATENACQTLNQLADRGKSISKGYQ